MLKTIKLIIILSKSLALTTLTKRFYPKGGKDMIIHAASLVPKTPGVIPNLPSAENSNTNPVTTPLHNKPVEQSSDKKEVPTSPTPLDTMPASTTSIEDIAKAGNVAWSNPNPSILQTVIDDNVECKKISLYDKIHQQACDDSVKDLTNNKSDLPTEDENEDHYMLKRLKELEQQGLIEHPNNDRSDYKLTEEGRELYKNIQGTPLILKNPDSFQKKGFALESDSFLEVSTTSSIAVVFTNISDDTVLPTPEQLHVISGTLEEATGDFTGTVVLTHTKGGNAITGKDTMNTFLSKDSFSQQDNNQVKSDIIMGEKKPKQPSQYGYSLIPPRIEKEANYTIHEEATTYVNRPDVIERLVVLENISKKYEPIQNSSQGITMNDLEEMSELKEQLDNRKEIKTIPLNNIQNTSNNEEVD